MDEKQLIESLGLRATSTRWGIGTAAQYVKSVEGCLFGDLCSVDDWRKAVKEAAGRLTWCDEEMGDPDAVVKSVLEKAAGSDSGLPDGLWMSFDCTLTSSRKDRDGDILDPSGMKVDGNMPLLWQHLPMQPIGRVLKVLEQSDDRIRVKFGIADTPLGRDAGTLVKCGCLRMSHGFKPFEFEPVDQKSDGTPTGWHVKSGEIREGSLVSIPSNVDGIIDAYSEGGLTTPLVKSWAKSYYDSRPVQVPVNLDLTVKVNGQELGAKATVEPPTTPPAGGPKPEPADDPTAPAGDKSDKSDKSDDAQPKEASPVPQHALREFTTKMLGGERHLEGSFEWVQEKLREAAEGYLQSQGKSVGDAWVDLVATFTDQAIVCVHNYGSREYPCYRMSWKTNDDGLPIWTGDVTEVEIKPTVIEKAIEMIRRKAGVLPPEDLGNLCVTHATKTTADDSLEALEPVARQLGATVEMLKQQQVGELLGV